METYSFLPPESKYNLQSIQILFSSRNQLFVWRRRLSITPTIFAREFSLWCGRGTEPSAIARGRGETKIIDLIEGADKRPFTSLWITLRVSTCIYIYIGLSDTFGRATEWMGVGRIVNSSPIGWWHARVSLENDPPWIETAKRSTRDTPSCCIIVPFYPSLFRD